MWSQVNAEKQEVPSLGRQVLLCPGAINGPCVTVRDWAGS